MGVLINFELTIGSSPIPNENEKKKIRVQGEQLTAESIAIGEGGTALIISRSCDLVTISVVLCGSRLSSQSKSSTSI